VAPTDSSFDYGRRARRDPPWDLDAPWVVEPPSRLAFPLEDEPASRRLLRALADGMAALLNGRRG
jgi:hypothetical protein